jgi:hypothetical protein
MTHLDPATGDNRWAWTVLLEHLADEQNWWSAWPSSTRQRRTSAEGRAALLGLLPRQADRELAFYLEEQLALLDVTVDDLSAWHAWPLVTTVLLSAVRRNSTPPDWLKALPSLAGLSGS